MALPPDVLRGILRRASTPAERLGRPFAPGAGQGSAHLLRTWTELVAKGDEARFQDRLDWLGWDRATAERVLGEPALDPAAPLPAWALALDGALDFAAGRQASSGRGATPTPNDPVPFQDLMAPLVAWALHGVETRSSGLGVRVDAAAWTGASRWLLQELARLHAGALFADFRAFRAASSAASGGAERGQEGSAGLYKAWAADWIHSGAPAFYAAYPVLARLAGTMLLQWQDALREMLERLAEDVGTIHGAFPGFPRPEVLEDLRFGLSDRHFGGRVVAKVTLDSGLVLAYKPKPIDLEAALSAFLLWLGDRGAPETLRALTVVALPTHGWVEWVEPGSCEGEASAVRYYRRAGALLCVSHWLCATDCHYENLLAGGEDPVLVDAEAILHPHRRLPDAAGLDRAASYEAERVINESVLGTGFLPRWIFYADGSSYDLSGLGTTPGATMPFRVTEWDAVNTDAMERRERAGRSPGRSHGPRLDGVLASPTRFASSVVGGFEAMYRFGMERREEMLAKGGPMGLFSGLSSRYILRPTVTYGVLADWMHRPAAQRDGARTWIQLDLLSSDLLQPDTRHLQPVLDDEVAALLRLDVPCFQAPVDRDALVCESGLELPGVFVRPSLVAARERLSEASEEALALQSYLIRSSLMGLERTSLHEGSDAPEGAAGTPANAEVPGVGGGRREGAGPVHPSWLLEEAERIGRSLAQHAIRGDGGRRSWIGLVYKRDAGRFQLQPTDSSLYEGSAGIGFFLAALHKATGDRRWRDLALGALTEVMDACGTAPLVDLARRAGQVVPAGLGNLVYGLTSASAFLGDDGPVEAARSLARRLEPHHAADDEGLDVLFGSAGMCLGLLRLHQSVGEPWILDMASAFGRRLVDASEAGPHGGRGWPSEYGRPLTGFSHGASGMAYALLRLWERVPDPSFRERAEEGVAFEGGHFLSEESNWPDLRYPLESGRRGMSWCHGAPGIGIGRVGALDLLDTPEVRRDVAGALAAAGAAPPRTADHLCCGTLGIAEFHLCSGLALDDDEVLARGTDLLRGVLAEASVKGRYRLSTSEGAHADGCYPGLFQGESGVGYALLRFADPESFPSLLLFR